ncbi:MAG: hypothetical protein ABI912_06185, partial [Actinomycetota bacterium]
MRRHYGLLVALVVLTACTGTHAVAKAAEASKSVTASVSAPLPSAAAPAPAPATPVAAVPLQPSPEPIPRATAPSHAPDSNPEPPGIGRPPQFVVISFDGAGSTSLFQHWRDAAAAANHAHFTFFLSGVYLLPKGERVRYHPPHHNPGRSDIGFFDAGHVARLHDQLSAAYREGHEIGTHFNGHFCAGRPGSIGTWTTADWNAEMDQFDSFLTDAKLPFGPAEVVGGRTPCLQGRPDQLFPALTAHGFRYDASGTSAAGKWPVRRGNLWEFPLQSLPIAGTTKTALSMDYNMYFSQSRGVDGPRASVAAYTEQALATYENAFQRSYVGNRAPLLLGNHFERWNGGAYT